MAHSIADSPRRCGKRDVDDGNAYGEIAFKMYRPMIRIREFESAAMSLSSGGQVKGAGDPSIGQEASGAGVWTSLRKDDLIAGTHLSDGRSIAKGADTKQMMARILGKETGYYKGRGGSMHIAAFETPTLGGLAAVGSGIPIAAGTALAFKTRDEGRLAVRLTREGRTSTGDWHEGPKVGGIGRPAVPGASSTRVH